uniref:Uncharacterized protein n=1 Tax=Arundo donax TaxID=35708 RepID=A0A0A9GL02_ARUDO
MPRTPSPSWSTPTGSS